MFLSERQITKNPAPGGVLYHLLTLTAQAIAVIATVSVNDNQRGLQWGNVTRCRTFGAIFDGEGNLLTFIKSFVAVALDCREMYEYIFAAIVWSDETKTFIRVEPFY